jgi:hypothetical protein
MMRRIFSLFVYGAIAALAASQAHAGEAALLLEEPFGHFGVINPTGHAAVYLSDVCAETPTELRRCGPGESGAVLSRYHRIGGYDWLAVPLIPYLYAVDDPSEIPDSADLKLEATLRDRYRRAHLMALVPDDPVKDFPEGEWTQLIGAAYDRRIYGFAIETRQQQDDALIAGFNARANVGHFNLFFNNCANFAADILNFYYPHSIHRNFIADVGIMTPKQTARSLVKYSKRHSDLDSAAFLIPQVPGVIHRSTPVNGVVESLVKSKKYVLPLAYLHPAIVGTLVIAYLGNGRFQPDSHADIFDPAIDLKPGLTIEQNAEMAGSLTAFEMNLEPATTSFEERAKSATLGANDAAVGVIAAEK